MTRRKRKKRAGSEPRAVEIEPVAAGAFRYYGLLAGLCCVAAVILRLAYLSADPPWDFTWSQALFTDGARAIDGARCKIVFGTWIADSRSPVVLFYPLANLLAYAIFRLGGVGLAQANLAGVIPALGSLALACFGLRRAGSRPAAVVATCGFAFCYPHIVYSRVPMVESLLIFMLLGAFWLALGGAWRLFLSGLVVGLAAFMVKMHALHMVPVVLVFLAMTRRDREGGPGALRLALLFLAGAAVAVAAWIALVYSVSPEIVGKYFRSNILLSQQGEYAGASLQAALLRRIDALVHIGSGRDGFFAETPVLSVLAFAGLVGVVSGMVRGKPSARPWESLAAIWFVGLAASLSLLSYRPLRYMVLLAPSTILLAASFLARLAEGRPLLFRRKPSWFLYAFAAWLGWALIHLQHDLIYRSISGGRGLVARQLTPGQISAYRFHAATWLHVLIFGGAAVGITLVLRHRLRSAEGLLPRRARTTIVVVCLVLAALLGSVRFAGWTRSRHYSLLDAGRSLERVLSDGVFLVGDCSTTIALENDFRTLPAYGDLIRYEEKSAFEQYPVTHFLLRFPTLFEYLSRNYPDFTKRAQRVISFPLCGREATVVRYEAWPGYAAASYSPSGFERGMGFLLRDQPDEARAGFEAFLAGHPRSGEALTALAVCHLQLGGTQEALDSVERALEVNPRDALAYEIRGDILDSMGRSAEARRDWEKALKLNPVSRKLRGRLGIQGG